ncbi:MAG: hypothetical protein M3063_14330, partial [Actinomycetota bacterium]|nr:hypothetical protein [Actinomycetota bacterium]
YTLFPYGADLRTDFLPAPFPLGIFTTVTGSAPNRVFNIEWRATLFPGVQPANFEIQLYEGQPRFDFVYGTTADGGSGEVVGVEKGSSPLFTQLSCKTPSLSPGLRLSFTSSTAPQISVTKVASPISLAAPGGTFTYTAQVNNPSAVDPVKITSLVDNIYGDLATRTGSSCGALIGVTLAPGATSPACSFTGPFAGKSGDTQTDTVTVTGVDSNGNTVTATANATVSLTKATPTIATQASPGNLLGAPVHDTATVSGGSSPTGSVTFSLFSDAACATQVFTSTNPLGGGTATSDTFTPAAAGTYYWTASYSGDANNNAVPAPCGAANESVVIAPFAPPTFTRTITGDFLGPLTVNAGDSVLITTARVVGPVTVNPGGALGVVDSQISRGIVANGPSFFSVCGSQVSAPSTTPGQGIVVSNATVPIRIGDPAAGCAFNRVAGDVSVTGNTAGLTLGANIVSGNVTVNNNTVGTDVLKANNVSKALACVSNSPPPTNAGQTNTAGSKSGQCSTL